jgi:hypothetical protein
MLLDNLGSRRISIEIDASESNQLMRSIDKGEHEPDLCLMEIGKPDMDLSPTELPMVLYFSVWRWIAGKLRGQNRSDQCLPMKRSAPRCIAIDGD